ncbi:hypothetical protein RN001_004802 [Aquatica leii]|uniref:Uncharacterized protein n=1 Tax=Aquatica leii TaxID=1421715 RepID=A0AAN7PC34_9COLE|nr:hypothetical protein RN001_004802 [Aquatica leii]
MYHCVTPSTSTMPMGYDAPRRQNYGVTRRLSSGEGTVIPSKRRRYNYYRLESESSHASGGDTETTESIYSHQGYETELVMDTPDTESKSELSDSDEDLEIEYEVQSLSENENAPVGSDSSSGAEVTVAGAITAVICEPSLEPSLTDGEDSDNSSLAEIQIQRTNYDACMQCKLRNDNPLFRYCKKCFQVRKTFFPPRPRGFKKKIRKSKDRLIHNQKVTNLPDLTKEDDIKGIKSSSSESNLEEKENLNSPLLECKELCIMCNAEPKNCIFLHGCTAHMCCCYKCALKSWKLNKKCPACNRKANNVVKVFVV